MGAGWMVLGARRMVWVGVAWAAGAAGQTPLTVAAVPAPTAVAKSFADRRYGVRFQVPPGWTLARRDGVLSNFRLDVKSAPATSVVRAVANMEFNPFPRSTLSGALLYVSVQPRADEAGCAAQAAVAAEGETPRTEVVPIGGMGFTHGHREQGSECVEVRDDVYTAYRRHTCYRLDLEVNTFCAGASGAQEITPAQIHDVEARMAGMLSTMSFPWEKSGPQAVPVPDVPVVPRRGMKPEAGRGSGGS